jgi:hypothetical protein
MSLKPASNAKFAGEMRKKLPHGKSMSRKLVLLILFAAMVYAAGRLGAGALAQDFPRRPPGHERMAMTPFEPVLNPQQKQTMSAMIKADRAKLQSLRERLHQAREALIEKLISPGASIDVSKESADLKAAQAAMVDERVAIALAVRKLLSPQQLKDAAAFHDKLEELHRQEESLLQQMGGGKGGPPPGDE